MPQMVTYQVSVKVDNGPEVKGLSKLEAGSYSASVEELVCRGGTVELDVNAKPSDVEMLVITSSAYVNEKEPCPATGQLSEKLLKFRFTAAAPEEVPGLMLSGGCCRTQSEPPPLSKNGGQQESGTYTNWCPLTRPFILGGPMLGGPYDKEIKSITFQNNLGTDVKVSVLVVRPRKSVPCQL
jgi:hypothetical protein